MCSWFIIISARIQECNIWGKFSTKLRSFSDSLEPEMQEMEASSGREVSISNYALDVQRFNLTRSHVALWALIISSLSFTFKQVMAGPVAEMSFHVNVAREMNNVASSPSE